MIYKVRKKMKIHKKMEKKGPRSLKRGLLLFILLCWAVPNIVFFCFITRSYREGIMTKTERIMEDQLVSAASFTAIRIEDVINICQSPSYERTWEQAWRKYNADEMLWTSYIGNINSSLRGKFHMDDRFRLYAYYEKDGKEPSCYASRVGISRNDYLSVVDASVKEWIAEGLDYTHVEIIDGRLFIMRNLYSMDRYEYFGTLVVELNKNKVLQDIPGKQRENMIICIDDARKRINFTAVSANTGQEKLIEKSFENYNGYSRGTVKKERNRTYNAYLYQRKFDNYHMGIVYLAERKEIYSSLYGLYEMVMVMAILFIPILIYVVYFLQRQIQEPVKRLMAAYRKMEAGDIGVKVSGGEMPNAEFNYLKDSFDSMSEQVKGLFDYIYDEKLARKDAQILALQAQINPHFLNNTLEMMNWQARMSGDAVVSKMIESLGTVLDYRMNRANVKEIYLADELRCTDAYFYIMSMRFGQRLSVERDIDQELLYIKVPPLILQPLVENAIVHGVESAKSGSIGVHIFHDETCIYLKVTNTGKKFTQEELQRVQAILAGDAAKIPQGKGKHTSIGIRNVNQRIKLVYGDKYGLSITQEEEGVTVSTIVLPYRLEEENKLTEEELHKKGREEVENEIRNINKSKKEF